MSNLPLTRSGAMAGGWTVHFNEPLGQGKAQARSFRSPAAESELYRIPDQIQKDLLGFMAPPPAVQPESAA